MTSALPPVLRALIDICGPAFARLAGPADTVAGRVARFVAGPATATAVADTLRLAATRGLAVRARGAGTKLDWGTPPPGVDVLLDTGRLAGVWHHDPAAGTAEVGAGTPVRAVQARLALRGQRLAVDPPSAGATIGGMLAVNESGPLRHRYGTAADQVRHLSYVDRAGELGTAGARPGGTAVDGVIVSANLRLEPLPAARRWVFVAVSTPLQVHNLVEETLAQRVDPSAIEVDLPRSVPRTTEQPPGSLAVLLEGAPTSVADRAARLAVAIGDHATISEIAPRWWGRYPFGHDDVALRIAVPIADLHAAVYALRDAAGAVVPIRGSAGLGTVHAVLPGGTPPERVEAILDAVRGVLLARGGRAVVISAPPPTARVIDVADYHDLF
ncbi:glycolate oxidase FAD binding subunit [Krasilnikovia cinnamomea]|uniref:Glycolate oxidase FAD binding subunit n=1 Tax=Krasilnikovia cinnamomea TaxID=349313 RepID=A0A4Q7ZKI9_9ACTN|nr:FAD-binding oxidoreductase [Krasilnikovia cinnamomea]RZU51448.1 glycolate oxidase FAD binding subunit [Krasilnikovia cinnamomea]